jgi:hypothetical protein
MELKQFVKNVLKDLVDAVEEARNESCRGMNLTSSQDNRTVEFDIAVTVEDSIASSGKAGIKVFQIIEGGGNMSKELKNSEVSRIKFGVSIDSFTKEELSQIGQTKSARPKSGNYPRL